MLGNPNTGSVVPVTSENYFAPTTDVPSGVAPFVPASTTINQVSLSHQTTVVGKAKSAIAEYSHSGVINKDALATLQRKFGQPHAVVGAHLDKLSNFPPLKMHNSENVIGFSSANTKHVSTNAAVGDIHSQESTKGPLPVVSLAVSSHATMTNALALFDSASTHSWVSADLHLVGTSPFGLQ